MPGPILDFWRSRPSFDGEGSERRKPLTIVARALREAPGL